MKTAPVGQLAWGPARQDTGHVLVREDGALLHTAAVSKRFGKLCREAGVQVIRFTDLRHTHATPHLLAGVPPVVVKERRGHANIAETLARHGASSSAAAPRPQQPSPSIS